MFGEKREKKVKKKNRPRFPDLAIFLFFLFFLFKAFSPFPFFVCFGTRTQLGGYGKWRRRNHKKDNALYFISLSLSFFVLFFFFSLRSLSLRCLSQMLSIRRKSVRAPASSIMESE